MYEITCPACGETVCVDEDLLLSEDLACPACGEKFEVDFDDVDDTVHFNGKPVDEFFSRVTGRMIVRQPLELVDQIAGFDILA